MAVPNATTNPLSLTPVETSVAADKTDGTTDGARLPDGDAQAEEEKAKHRFDPTFTENVVDAIGPKAAPRVRQVMASLIRHLHDFARENEITVDEWMAGVEMVGAPFCVHAATEDMCVEKKK